MSEIIKMLFKIFSVILHQFLETAGKDLLDFPNFGKGKIINKERKYKIIPASFSR